MTSQVMRLNLVRADEPAAFSRFADDQRRARLTFVSENGARRTLPYFQLKDVEWDPDLAAIILTFLDRRVTIYGRNLLELCGALEEDDAGLIEERHVREHSLAEGECFIERIAFEQI